MKKIQFGCEVEFEKFSLLTMSMLCKNEEQLRMLNNEIPRVNKARMRVLQL